MGALDKITESFKPVDEVKQTISMLLYGLPGSGKTFLAAQAAKTMKVGVIMMENGSLTLRGSGCDVYNAYESDKVQARPDFWAQLVVQWAHSNSCPYDMIVLDTISAWHMMLYDAINAKTDRVDMHQWLRLKDATRSFAMGLARCTARHVMVLCHAKEDKVSKGRNKEDYYTVIRPEIIGKNSASLAAEFDYVGYCERGRGGRHQVRWRGSEGDIVAKDRSGQLDDVEPADFDTIFSKIQGVHTSEKTQDLGQEFVSA